MYNSQLGYSMPIRCILIILINFAINQLELMILNWILEPELCKKLIFSASDNIPLVSVAMETQNWGTITHMDSL